jgi:hypothetical protein
MVGGQRPIEPINRIMNSPKWKNDRQHWEIQPFVAEINLHHTKFDLSNKNQSQELIKPEMNAQIKRSHKTDAGNSCKVKNGR